jgi:hypothetical protein
MPRYRVKWLAKKGFENAKAITMRIEDWLPRVSARPVALNS